MGVTNMDENSLLRDILNRLNEMPSRYEFNNLVAELKEYVTRSEFQAEMRRVNEKQTTFENALRDNGVVLEEYKRARLPGWMAWVFPGVVTAAVQLYLFFHPAHH